MSYLQNWWDQALLKQARMFIPSEEFLERGQSVANKLFRALQTHSKCKIDRAGIVGSVEKKTSLSVDVDYDCVVFVNDFLPPFDKVVDDFEDIVDLHLENAKLSAKNIGKALQITLDGLEFDVLPAVNLSQDPEIQRRRVMEEIRKLPRPASSGYLYSSSLCQTAVEFIKRQSPFTHDVIRLAKFWNKTILFTEKISGRSALIELIAIYVAKEEEQKSSSPSLLRAFTSFLDKMKNIKNLNIIFKDFYEEREIHDYIKRQRPLILDPANPYNNFGYTFIKKKYLMNEFRNYALTTLGRLSSHHNNLLHGLIYVFEAQPKIAPIDLVGRYLPNSDTTTSTYTYKVEVNSRSNANSPNMIVRNERVVNDNKVGVEILKHYFLRNAQLVNDRNLPDNASSREEIEGLVQRVVDINIEGKSEVGNWIPYDGPNDEDVTFEVPTGPSLVRVGVKW